MLYSLSTSSVTSTALVAHETWFDRGRESGRGLSLVSTPFAASVRKAYAVERMTNFHDAMTQRRWIRQHRYIGKVIQKTIHPRYMSPQYVSIYTTDILVSSPWIAEY